MLSVLQLRLKNGNKTTSSWSLASLLSFHLDSWWPEHGITSKGPVTNLPMPFIHLISQIFKPSYTKKSATSGSIETTTVYAKLVKTLPKYTMMGVKLQAARTMKWFFSMEPVRDAERATLLMPRIGSVSYHSVKMAKSLLIEVDVSHAQNSQEPLSANSRVTYLNATMMRRWLRKEDVSYVHKIILLL